MKKGTTVGIAGILAAVCGLSALGVMVQSRISPEMALSHLMHIVTGGVVCIGLYFLGYERLVKLGKLLILPVIFLILWTFAGFHGRMLSIGGCGLFAPGLWMPFALCLLFAGWIQKHPERLEASPVKKAGILFGIITAIGAGLLFCQPWYSLAAMTVVSAWIFYSLGRYSIRNLAKSVFFWIFAGLALLLLCCPARIFAPYIGSMRLPSADTAKWAMESSAWFGKGVSELEQITVKNMPFPEADMAILTGTLEFGKIYLAVAVLFFVVLLISAVSLTVRIKDTGRRVIVGGMAAIILLPVILNFAVHAGFIPVFFVNLPFISCGSFCVTILSFSALGCLLAACRNSDNANMSRCKCIAPAAGILLTILPAVATYFAMQNTVCRMPSGFLLTRIEKQTHPSPVAVYDVFFSREGTALSAGDLEKYFSKINRQVKDRNFNSADFAAYHVTHPLASGMSEAEVRILTNELKKDGFLNHFFFHKRFIVTPALPLAEKLEAVSEIIAAEKHPKAFYAGIIDISTGQTVKEIINGEPLPNIIMASALKPFIIISAVENKIVSCDSEIDCKDGSATWGMRRISDVCAYGKIPVREILKNQSNIGTALIAEKTGFAKINKTLADYGLPPLADEVVYACLGHETEATLQQLISAYLKLLKNPEFAQRLSFPLTCSWIRQEADKAYSSTFSSTIIDLKDGYLIAIIAEKPQNTKGNLVWLRNIWNKYFTAP